MTDPISAWRGKRVLVLGDAINDVFVQVASTRKSPEADCEIAVLSNKVIERPGGAANVAANIEALGGQPRLICANRQFVSTKTRYVEGRRHIVRLDHDITMPKEHAPHVLASFTTNLPWADIVVLSDYAKGVLCDEVLIPAIKAAKEAGKTVIVDPKRNDWSAYRGADVMTPNQSEFGAAANKDAVSDAVVVVTLGVDGMRASNARWNVTIPAVSVDAPDVCGAGDTVVAALALAMCVPGYGAFDAAKIANAAAAIAVSKPHTATVTADELRGKI